MMTAAAVADSTRSAFVGSSSSSSSVCVTLHYLGPPGTYSHQVAQALAPRLRLRRSRRRCDGADSGPKIPSSRTHNGPSASGRDALEVRLQPCDTIHDTVRRARDASLKRKDSVFLALMPYENNSNGPVVDSHNIVQTTCDGHSIRIVGEAYLPVSHSLLVTRETEDRLKAGKTKVNKSDLSRLQRVSSHVQALGQCSHFIQKYMDSTVVLRETSSTGEAARLLVQGGQSNNHTDAAKGAASGEETGAAVELEACIASKVCAQADVYDLVELFGDIQNSHGNTTRFLLCQASSEDAEYEGDAERYAARIVVDAVESVRLPPRARALFRIITHNSSSALLTTCLAKLAGADKLALTITRIDRQTIIADESGVQSNEGRWASSYTIEVQAEWRQGGNDGDVEDARKRRKAEADATSSEAYEVAAELEDVASRMQEETRSLHSGHVACLGSWIV